MSEHSHIAADRHLVRRCRLEERDRISLLQLLFLGLLMIAVAALF